MIDFIAFVWLLFCLKFHAYERRLREVRLLCE